MTFENLESLGIKDWGFFQTFFEFLVSFNFYRFGFDLETAVLCVRNMAQKVEDFNLPMTAITRIVKDAVRFAFIVTS
ncbi:UNVERIFIED_CONTAM: hypothetical protein NCL1_24819 [Trichonephila clavipes]